MNYQTNDILREIKGDLCIFASKLRVQTYLLFHRRKRIAFELIQHFYGTMYDIEHKPRQSEWDRREYECLKRNYERLKRKLPDFVLEYLGLL